MQQQPLPFHDLAERHPGLTAAIASYYAEAARVCLDRHHSSPIAFAVDRAGAQHDATAEWMPTDEGTRSAWANEIDTTEAGAYCIALATLEAFAGMVAVHRAETGTGADYYIAPLGSDREDLESSLRLEVSGVDRGEDSVVRQRLRQKLEQANRGNSNLPALAAVVGFSAKLIAIAAASEDS